MAPNILQQNYALVSKYLAVTSQPYITFTEMNENIPDSHVYYSEYRSRVRTCSHWGRCISWTLDCGLDHGLDYGLEYGLEYGLLHGLVLLVECTAPRVLALPRSQQSHLVLLAECTAPRVMALPRSQQSHLVLLAECMLLT